MGPEIHCSGYNSPPNYCSLRFRINEVCFLLTQVPTLSVLHLTLVYGTFAFTVQQAVWLFFLFYVPVFTKSTVPYILTLSNRWRSEWPTSCPSQFTTLPSAPHKTHAPLPTEYGEGPQFQCFTEKSLGLLGIKPENLSPMPQPSQYADYTILASDFYLYGL